MKRHLFLLSAVILMLSACGSGGASDNGPAVAMELRPMNLSSNVLYFRGPVPLQFEMTVTNPTNEAVTLQSLDLRSVGPGAFRLRSGSVPVNRTIPPGGSTTLTLSTWGQSAGGFLRSEEPVTLRAVGAFRSASGKSFMKMENENIMP
jgi:hypothetical protein